MFRPGPTIPFTTTDGRPGAVRPARPGDARAVLAIVREAAAERPRTISTDPADLWSAREWRAHRMEWGPRGVTLVAEIDGAVVAILGCSRARGVAFRHTAQFGITVAAGHRGRGVGRALLAALERWAGEHGIDRIELGVYPGNDAARRLYDAAGYEVEGTQRRAVRFPDGDLDIVMMAKLLPRGASHEEARRYHDPATTREGERNA